LAKNRIWSAKPGYLTKNSAPKRKGKVGMLSVSAYFSDGQEKNRVGPSRGATHNSSWGVSQARTVTGTVNWVLPSAH
jgi:hypothetical protein